MFQVLGDPLPWNTTGHFSTSFFVWGVIVKNDDDDGGDDDIQIFEYDWISLYKKYVLSNILYGEYLFI